MRLSVIIPAYNATETLAAHKIPRYGSALKTPLTNGEGARNILEAAWVRHQDDGLAVRVVMASTSDVYGKSPELPFDEGQNLLLGPSHVPRWAYATSKLFDEHLAFAYSDEYGFPTVSMRFLVSGPVSSILPSAEDLITPRGPNFFRNSGSLG